MRTFTAFLLATWALAGGLAMGAFALPALRR